MRMSRLCAVLIVFSSGLVVGAIAGVTLQRQGYGFGRSFIGGWLAGTGISGILMNIILDYI